MDGSGIKGMKLKGCDAVKRKRSEIGRIRVSGYDTNLGHDDVENALRKHFSPCGEITDVYIDEYDNILQSPAFIYFLGGGAVDNALQLSGTDVGGWNVFAEPYPFPINAGSLSQVVVRGYDTWLSEIDIESALRKHFSSCGEIDELWFYKKSLASVSIKGEDAEDKVLELDGSVMGGRKLSVRPFSQPKKYTVHCRNVRPRLCGRRL